MTALSVRAISATIVLTLGPALVLAASHAPDARSDEIALANMLAKANDCDDWRSVDINELQYFDFGHSGSENLVVVASTCGTGTAGPDIHAVYARNSDGTFSELPVPDVDKRYYEGMVGNRNYRLFVLNGDLVAMWHDRSSRPMPPLTITYRWNGTGFEVKSISAPYAEQSSGK